MKEHLSHFYFTFSQPKGKCGRGTRDGSFGKHHRECCSNSKTALMTNTFPPDIVNIGACLPPLTSSANLITNQRLNETKRNMLLENYYKKVLEDERKIFAKIILDAEVKMRDDENRFKTKSKRLKGELIESRAQALKAEEMSQEYSKKRLDLEKELHKERGKVLSLRAELIDIRFNLSRLETLRHFLFRAAPDWWQKKVFREGGIGAKIGKFKATSYTLLPSRENIIKERKTPSWLRRHVGFQLSGRKSESKDELSLSAFDNLIAATQSKQFYEWDDEDMNEIEMYFTDPTQLMNIFNEREDSVLKLLNELAHDDYDLNTKFSNTCKNLKAKKHLESIYQQYKDKNSQLDHLQKRKARHFVLYHLEIAKNEIEGPNRELRYSDNVT